MNLFTSTIAQWLSEVFHELMPSETWDQTTLENSLETPPDSSMGDYGFPCFLLAKKFRKAPPQIAIMLCEKLEPAVKNSPLFCDVNALGPYLNFRVNFSSMAAEVLPRVYDGSYFRENAGQSRKKVMIEYSQPNTHKGFHVGHLRNVALGDCLCRVYRYNGYEVIAANYIGDVGTHIAKCLWYYEKFNQETPPETLKGEWLGTLYTKATLMLEDASDTEKVEYQQEISRILAALESKDSFWMKKWAETRQWSLDDFNEIYQWLDAHFDHVFYESDVDDIGKQLVLAELEKGTFIRSQGAVGLDLEDASLGFFMLLKTDGNTLYSTKDLALAQKKFDEFRIEHSIYVVGSEQTLHFKQVFETLKRMGYAQAEACFHLPYGLVVLPSGKMSSRKGNVIMFSDLRQQVTDYIRKNYLDQHAGDWDDAEIQETARQTAVAALRYGMLNQDPNKQIVFSMEDWLVSEGDTGTYLIYAYVRVRSIRRQVPVELTADVSFDVLTHPNEHALIRKIYDFNQMVSLVGAQYRPSLLTKFLFEMCKDFSRAYNTCSIKFAENSEIQSARLLLFHSVAEILKQGLFLLGITPPERM
ncbi:MAG: arginine--tRNA ligase [SAR324 cluster bacterium]|nr:arginine--tRNA ligase [SAR324 cluster bacterium]